LKDYIVAEGQDKRGIEISRDSIKGFTAKGIPEQTNFCDCGVYIVAYVEALLKDPKEFIMQACAKELQADQWFGGFESGKKRAEIREELLGLAVDQKAKRRLEKKARIEEKKRQATAESGSAAANSPAPPNSGATKSEKRYRSTTGLDGAEEASSVAAPTPSRSRSATKASEPPRSMSSASKSRKLFSVEILDAESQGEIEASMDMLSQPTEPREMSGGLYGALLAGIEDHAAADAGSGGDESENRDELA